MVIHDPITVKITGSYLTGWVALVMGHSEFKMEYRTAPKKTSADAFLGLVRGLREAGFTGRILESDDSDRY